MRLFPFSMRSLRSLWLFSFVAIPLFSLRGNECLTTGHLRKRLVPSLYAAFAFFVAILSFLYSLSPFARYFFPKLQSLPKLSSTLSISRPSADRRHILCASDSDRPVQR